MRWLITGAAGMLGSEVCRVLELTGPAEEVTAATRADLDLLDAQAVDAAVQGHDVVVNCGGWTDVDGAEAREAEATAVNGYAVAELAASCARARTLLFQVSTDYVFGGDLAPPATGPYPEDAPTAPVNAYGRGKLAGEQAVLKTLPDRGYVLRTAWLYAASGRNFVTTMLRLAGQRDTVDVVDDQRGQPTWAFAMASQLVALVGPAAAGKAPPGIYHATASGETTWYGLARAVFAEAGLDPDRVRPTVTDKFPRPALRPTYSVLGHARWARTGLAPLPDWRGMLSQAMAHPAFAAVLQQSASTEES
jgi:dTDP-4-dehydrorhamnose reductase